MQYNFDEVINRKNTDSFKWDFFNDPEGTIPMPVADMDFRSAEPILEALREVTEHGVFGYSVIPEVLRDVFQERLERLYGWKAEKDWQVWIPGLVPAITATCRAIGEIGEGVMTSIPVYHPFHLAPNYVGKKLQTFPMKEVDNRWTFDFEALEKAITSDTKLFMLCNPYNPAGTVFTKEELEQLVTICKKHEIVICSDEIHCDLILDESKKHIPIASLSEEAANMTITLLAPSKTFNIAGLGCSVAVIPNPELRKKFEDAKNGFFPPLTRHSLVAALVAYRDCEDWRLQLVDYLKTNHDFLYQELNGYKGLKMLPLEATYLAWIDAKETGIADIQEKILKAGVRLMNGNVFMGEGFLRLNFACPKSVLEEAVKRIKSVL
ncbi:cystathionine beta-lyase [Arcicella aurantiaca]|uniref:cysteine-S-conjugate beta-lyase n=1 Tax=Arcicella aurantiaca TaxID=591202 RepID=A0A316EQ57_9BACT|nr:PatB family C-S lyase [Arcicella aurantiaca]PWK25180.1 cystathionine beta-lyase [Arcicella aurantiaca]